MRPVIIALALASGLLALACETRTERELPIQSENQIETETPIPAEPPDYEPIVREPAPTVGDPRVIHEMGEPSEGCIEMITVCRPDESGVPLCTSAPVEFQCGETKALPSGERLRCECEEDPGT